MEAIELAFFIEGAQGTFLAPFQGSRSIWDEYLGSRLTALGLPQAIFCRRVAAQKLNSSPTGYPHCIEPPAG